MQPGYATIADKHAISIWTQPSINGYYPSICRLGSRAMVDDPSDDPKRREASVTESIHPGAGFDEVKSRIMESFGYLHPIDSTTSNNDKVIGELLAQTIDCDASDIVSDNTDPRLKDWTPDGPGICGPKGSRFVIENIKDFHSSEFSHFQHRIVEYRIESPSGDQRSRSALFTRTDGPYVYDIKALRAYLEEAVGEDILIHSEKLDDQMTSEPVQMTFEELIAAKQIERLPTIPQLYFKHAFWWLCTHLRTMDEIAHILEPLGMEGTLLLRAIEYRINATFSVVMEIRDGQLEDLHLANAMRGRRVHSASNRGGKATGERSKAHAEAWKEKFGKWLQPLIDEKNAQNGGRGISRDDAAALAESLWPKEGFEGLRGLPRQKAVPLRQTLLKALKELEAKDVIRRKSPPRGRRRR